MKEIWRPTETDTHKTHFAVIYQKLMGKFSNSIGFQSHWDFTF